MLKVKLFNERGQINNTKYPNNPKKRREKTPSFTKTSQREIDFCLYNCPHETCKRGWCYELSAYLGRDTRNG